MGPLSLFPLLFRLWQYLIMLSSILSSIICHIPKIYAVSQRRSNADGKPLHGGLMQPSRTACSSMLLSTYFGGFLLSPLPRTYQSECSLSPPSSLVAQHQCHFTPPHHYLIHLNESPQTASDCLRRLGTVRCLRILFRILTATPGVDAETMICGRSTP